MHDRRKCLVDMRKHWRRRINKKVVSNLYQHSLKISQLLSGIHFQAPRIKQDDLLGKEAYVCQDCLLNLRTILTDKYSIEIQYGMEFGDFQTCKAAEFGQS